MCYLGGSRAHNFTFEGLAWSISTSFNLAFGISLRLYLIHYIIAAIIFMP